jgi:hypothetical protein
MPLIGAPVVILSPAVLDEESLRCFSLKQELPRRLASRTPQFQIRALLGSEQI